MRASLASLFLVVIACCQGAPAPKPRPILRAGDVRYVSEVSLRNEFVGRHSARQPWQRQTLELVVGADGRVKATLFARSGEDGITCPGGAPEYGMQACVTEEEQERLSKIERRSSTEYRGVGRWLNGAFAFSLEDAAAGAAPIELRCTPNEAGYSCTVQGWPASWEWQTPETIDLAKS